MAIFVFYPQLPSLPPISANYYPNAFYMAISETNINQI
jgi:hypothetical protein